MIGKPLYDVDVSLRLEAIDEEDAMKQATKKIIALPGVSEVEATSAYRSSIFAEPIPLQEGNTA